MDVAGPAALAINVVSAEPSGASAKSVTLLSGTGYRGALVTQGPLTAAVITNDSADGALGSSLSYAVPAADGTVHVVVDAPVNSAGESDVSSKQVGSNCQILVTPHAGPSAGLDGRPLVLHTGANCSIADDGAQPDMGVTGTELDGATSAPASGAGGGGSEVAVSGMAYPSGGTVTTGCALRAPARRSSPASLLIASALGVAVLGRRRRGRGALSGQPPALR